MSCPIILSITGFAKAVPLGLTRQRDAERITVRELNQQLALELGDDFTHVTSGPETGQGVPRIAILVNGRHCSRLPTGLDTELHDGGEATIFPPAVGG